MTARQIRRVESLYKPDHDDLVDSEPWMDLARCAEVDADAFYPEKGGSTRPAKRVCDLCEVSSECLEYALRKDERFGIWGGKSERERREIRKQRGLEANAA